jgi:phosphotransferase system enzyme I (PtsI)
VRITGIPASPGIAVGPIVRVEREDLAVRETAVPGDAVDGEIAHFHAALDASRRDLFRIRDSIAAELGPSEARIYDAHALILDDPELTRAVEEGIRRGRNAAAVFRAHMSGVAAHLASVQDDYLRERRADVLDVERRVLRHLLGDGPRALTVERPGILVAHDIAPSDVALLDRQRVLGFVTEVGSRSSHCAIVARGRGIPAVVSAHDVLRHVQSGEIGAVDGYTGEFLVNPDVATVAGIQGRRARIEQEDRELDRLFAEPAVTRDGHRVELGANIELPVEAETAVRAGADGIGLFRTEFFYLNRLAVPGEEEQYQAYREVAERLAPRPVIFRTMDLGGDKVASYLGATHETNPFLGWRGIRFALHHPDLFRTQLRAMYRASAHGRARIMFPMISSQDELLRANALCTEVRAELTRAGVPFDPDVEIGLMIETPSAVWMADVLARDARFLSIGSNDLTQYTLAMDRDNAKLAHLYEPLDPAVLRSIRHTVEAGHAAGRWVGICGEMAGDPLNAVLLVGMGVDELSMSSFDLPRVKAAIRGVTLAQAKAVAREALAQPGARGVKEVLHARLAALHPGSAIEPGPSR